MLDLDSLLQEKLDALENGQAMEEIVASLPPEAEELETLLMLASAVRSAPHPEPHAEKINAQRSRIMAAAEIETRPIRRRETPAHRTSWPWTEKKWGFGAALSFAAAMVVLVWVGSALWTGQFSGDRPSARLENITGQVQVASSLNSSKWANASPGQQIYSGQRIRTLGASDALLVFFEGTRTYLGPDSELDLTQIHGSDSSLQVEITLKHGETRHDVIPLKGSRAFFLVHTPSGTASVHGTRFDVRVSRDGHAQVAVNQGEVRVQNANAEVILLAGQATASQPGQPPTNPAYQFTVQGSLVVIEEKEWIVSGVEFKVTPSTSITGNPQLGNTILVNGRVLEDGSRVADSIALAANNNQNAFFTGLLESTEGQPWQVSNYSIYTDANTLIDPGLSAGQPVKVTFNILSSGEWLALNIESLTEEALQPTEMTDPIPTTGAMPSLSFEPDDFKTLPCSPQGNYQVSGVLRNSGDSGQDFAANVQLGYLILSGGEYVQSIDITPNAWARIEGGAAANYAVNVGLHPDFLEAGEGVEVKLQIFVAQEANRPDHHPGRAMITIQAGCQSQPTATRVTLTPTLTVTLEPTSTGTLESTSTLTLTPTAAVATAVPTTVPTGVPTASPTEAWQCAGTDPQPTGMTLAQRYNVPYEEIMYWFCQNYGFGEIDLAYELSRASNLPVEQIFQMRASGLSWGEIKQQIAPEDKEKDKPKDK